MFKQGYIYLLFFSLFNGFLGVFVKLMSGATPVEITFFRAAITVMFVGMIIVVTGKFKDLQPTQPKLTVLSAIIQTASVVAYFAALQFIPVAHAVFLGYTAPIFSLFLAAIFLKEPIHKSAVIGVVLAVMGIIFIIDPYTLWQSQFGQLYGYGFGLLSGFLYAAMVITAKPIMAQTSSYYLVFWQYLIAVGLLFPLTRITHLPAIFAANWWQLLAVGIMCTGISFLLFMEGVKRVKGQEVLILASLEPVVGAVAASAVLGELPSWLTVVGAACILAGIYQVVRHQEVN